MKDNRIKIAPSILSADFSTLREEISRIEKAGADYIHIDVMDGHFVPNITVGPLIVKAVSRITHLPLDVHLMISHPDRYIEEFARSGSSIITIHAEAAVHLHRTVQMIKTLKKKAGVAVNPATPLSVIEEILPVIDLILVMTVNPGFGGQSFIPECLPKITRLRELIDESGRGTIELEVDGGVKIENIAAIARAGARVFVSGSGIFHQKNYTTTIQGMRRRAEAAASPSR